MVILKYTFQHRNDFGSILKCEHCNHEQDLNSGYNDHYYHNHVLPAIECKSCGKASKENAA
jgi:hypothetical protein